MIIKHQGQRYEITNWKEFQKKLLLAVGFQVEAEINNQINSMRLVDTGTFKSRTKAEVVNGELIITNSAPYAKYLEYGTLEYFRKFGKESFPTTPDPKKKDMRPIQRKAFPRGMQPFAPFRRVLYNQNKMAELITKAVKGASR